MYFRLAALLAATLLATLALSQMQVAIAQSDKSIPLPRELGDKADTHDFIISGSDGYGATECLATAGECGKIIADAWCESKGYLKSVNYRPAARDEVTASISGNIPSQAIIITCATSQ